MLRKISGSREQDAKPVFPGLKPPSILLDLMYGLL